MKRIPVGYLTTDTRNVQVGDVIRDYGQVDDIFELPRTRNKIDLSFVFPAIDGGLRILDFSDAYTVEVLQYREVYSI